MSDMMDNGSKMTPDQLQKSLEDETEVPYKALYEDMKERLSKCMSLAISLTHAEDNWNFYTPEQVGKRLKRHCHGY